MLLNSKNIFAHCLFALRFPFPSSLLKLKIFFGAPFSQRPQEACSGAHGFTICVTPSVSSFSGIHGPPGQETDRSEICKNLLVLVRTENFGYFLALVPLGPRFSKMFWSWSELVLGFFNPYWQIMENSSRNFYIRLNAFFWMSFPVKRSSWRPGFPKNWMGTHDFLWMSFPVKLSKKFPN